MLTRWLLGALENADPKDALEGFANVIKMETEKGEWCAGNVLCTVACFSRPTLGGEATSRLPPSLCCRGFKALKQMVKLHFKLGNSKEMMERYRLMLTYVKSAVTRNYSEKVSAGAVSSPLSRKHVIFQLRSAHIRPPCAPRANSQVINKILDFVSTSDQLELLADFYETTLKALEEARRSPALACSRNLFVKKEQHPV